MNREGGQVNRVVETGCFGGWTSESAGILGYIRIRVFKIFKISSSILKYLNLEEFIGHTKTYLAAGSRYRFRLG